MYIYIYISSWIYTHNLHKPVRQYVYECISVYRNIPTALYVLCMYILYICEGLRAKHDISNVWQKTSAWKCVHYTEISSEYKITATDEKNQNQFGNVVHAKINDIPAWLQGWQCDYNSGEISEWATFYSWILQ